MSSRCIIVAGGRVDLTSLRQVHAPGDYLLGADSGAVLLLEHGVRPHLAVGDFDSAGPEGLRRLEEAGVPIRRHPIEKDSTDTELAVELAVNDYQFFDILLFGGAGDRIDQTLATFFALSRWPEQGVRLRMWDNDWRAGFLGVRSEPDGGVGAARISGRAGQVVSLLPLSEQVTGVETESLHYPLRHETLCIDRTRGVSNELSGEGGWIRIRAGRLVVILNRPDESDGWADGMGAVPWSRG